MILHTNKSQQKSRSEIIETAFLLKKIRENPRHPHHPRSHHALFRAIEFSLVNRQTANRIAAF